MKSYVIVLEGGKAVVGKEEEETPTRVRHKAVHFCRITQSSEKTTLDQEGNVNM